LRLGTFFALRYNELNALSFGKGTISILLDRSVMHENVFTGIAFDESISF
jgi:hypothetical protein